MVVGPLSLRVLVSRSFGNARTVFTRLAFRLHSGSDVQLVLQSGGGAFGATFFASLVHQLMLWSPNLAPHRQNDSVSGSHQKVHICTPLVLSGSEVRLC